MPIAFNPFSPWSWLSSTTPKPASAASNAAVTQVGLFNTDGLIKDGPLLSSRQAALPTSLAELRATTMSTSR